MYYENYFIKKDRYNRDILLRISNSSITQKDTTLVIKISKEHLRTSAENCMWYTKYTNMTIEIEHNYIELIRVLTISSNVIYSLKTSHVKTTIS